MMNKMNNKLCLILFGALFVAVAEGGLQVGISIGDSSINDCEFIIDFDANVCDNLMAVVRQRMLFSKVLF